MSILRGIGSFIWFGVVGTIMILLIFSVLHLIGAPKGEFMDWMIGLAIFFWLLAIITVPWNMHFYAKEVLAEIAESKQKEIAVRPEHAQFVEKLMRLALLGALAAHLLSAAALYLLAFFGVTELGYLGAGAALLLIVLRPSIRAYEYVAVRLQSIHQQVLYPREDIAELRRRLTELEDKYKSALDLADENSWAAKIAQDVSENRQSWAQLRAQLDQFVADNYEEHTRLAREAEQSIAKLTADSQFLSQVREIIRFIKEA